MRRSGQVVAISDDFHSNDMMKIRFSRRRSLCQKTSQNDTKRRVQRHLDPYTHSSQNVTRSFVTFSIRNHKLCASVHATFCAEAYGTASGLDGAAPGRNKDLLCRLSGVHRIY